MKAKAPKTKKGKNSANISADARKRMLAGLKPFKPGQSGNPAGRPKGILDVRTRVTMAVDLLAEQYVVQHNKKHKLKITIDEVDIMGDVFAQLVNKARNGDQKAIDSLLDRVYGKATQPVEVGGIVGNPLAEAQRKAAMAEVEAWESQWENLGVKSGNKKHGSDTSDKRTKAKGGK